MAPLPSRRLHAGTPAALRTGLLAWSAAALCASAPALAQEPPAAATTTTMRTLIDWAERLSERKAPADAPAPALVPLPQALFDRTVCTDEPARCKSVVAAYDTQGKRVVVREHLNLDNRADQSFVVHELVHWLQQFSGDAVTDAPCARIIRAEREAYAVQNRFLDHFGHKLRVGGAMRFMACPPGESPTGVP